MSKMLPATCVGGVVTCEGVPVPSAVILSQGLGASSGVLVIDEDEARYLAKTSPDLDAALAQTITALNQAVSALNQIALSLTSIGAVPAPTWTPPPTIAADVVIIAAAATAITTAATQLTTLKGLLK